MTRAPSIISATSTKVGFNDGASTYSDTTLRPSRASGSRRSLFFVPRHADSSTAEELAVEEDDDSVPASFEIGSKHINPLVSLPQLQSHICLLASFDKLRNACLAAASTKASRVERDEAWNIYLTRAAYRFHVYTRNVLPNITSSSRSKDDGSGKKSWSASILTMNAKQLVDLDQNVAADAADMMRNETIDVPEHLLPPLDVAMIWHSYMLNPRCFREDAVRSPSQRVLLLARFPLHALARNLQTSNDSLQYTSDAATSFWREATGMPYELEYTYDPVGGLKRARDAKTDVSPNDGLFVQCPRCTSVRDGPGGETLSWEKLAISDWTEPRCARCKSKLNSNVLRGHRFVQDVERWLQDDRPAQEAVRMPNGYLAPSNGRYFVDDPHAPILCRLFDFKRQVSENDEGMEAVLRFVIKREQDNETQSAKSKLGKAFSGKDKPRSATTSSTNDLDTKDLNDTVTFPHPPLDIEGLSKRIDQAVRQRSALPNERMAIDRDRRVSLLMQPYIESDAFAPVSLNLAEAVKRQFAFVEEMRGMEWLEDEVPLAKDEKGTHAATSKGGVASSSKDVAEDSNDSQAPDYVHLARALVRYHKWLNVLAEKHELLCPTLDIDLVWHTHQLLPTYYADCFHAVGIFIDHNDKLTSPTLGAAFDRTGKLWYELYDQPYSVCGCPVHAGKTSGKLRSLKKSIFNRVTEKRAARESESTDSGDKAKSSAASHPSTHNLVVSPLDRFTEYFNNLRESGEKDDMQRGKRARGHHDAFVYVSAAILRRFFFNLVYRALLKIADVAPSLDLFVF